MLQSCLQTAFKRCERKWVTNTYLFLNYTIPKGGSRFITLFFHHGWRLSFLKTKTKTAETWVLVCSSTHSWALESKSLSLGNQGLLASYTLPRAQIYPSRETVKSKITSIHFYYWYYVEGKVWWVGMLISPCHSKCGPWT